MYGVLYISIQLLPCSYPNHDQHVHVKACVQFILYRTIQHVTEQVTSKTNGGNYKHFEIVEQVQATPGEVARVPSPEDSIVSNGDSMHDSSESEKLAEELGQLVNNNMNVVVSDKEDASKSESKLPKDKGKEEKKSKKKEDKTIGTKIL